jgi:hypothetical protein
MLSEIQELGYVTRNSSKSLRRQMVVDELKSCLKNIELVTGINNRIELADHIFRLIKHNKWFLTYNSRFNKVVIDKLQELINDDDPLISNRAREWHYEIYEISVSD